MEKLPDSAARNFWSKTRALPLFLLFCINLVNFFDRQILAPVAEPLRREWDLTDTQIGWLVTSFTLLYAIVGLPMGRLADTWRRTRLLSVGLALWSVFTFLSGGCRAFWQLFLARLVVGVGEATCAPSATSMIGDLFTPRERARAMSIFMLGLPAGVALSYLIGGLVAQHYGWRAVFFLAGVPGLILAGLIWFVRDPPRGAADGLTVMSGDSTRSPVRLILGIRTMQWIILSGLLHNFIMYALTFFLPALLIRHHGSTIQAAGILSAVGVGASSALGMLLGGYIGDMSHRRAEGGRMWVAALAVLGAAPAGLSALLMPSGATIRFMALEGVAILLMYMYYATVYATIHDVVEPSLRGRAMAIYFFAMYLLGGAMGPVAIGRLSDLLADRAAVSAGGRGIQDSDRFSSMGLHQAMFALPALMIVLSGILMAGAAAAPADMKRMQERQS